MARDRGRQSRRHVRVEDRGELFRVKGVQANGKDVDAGDIAARPMVAGDETGLHWTGTDGEDDRDGRGRLPSMGP